MDSYIVESTRSIRESATAFTDEVEGELEKMKLCGVHMTRKVTLVAVGLVAFVCISVGASLGSKFSSTRTGTDEGMHKSEYREDHRYAALGEAIESAVGKDIHNTSTHHYEALLWLADTDPMQIEIYSPIDEILQRFVVADFYFATKGAEWTDQFHFLSGKSVCGWNDKRYGVFCNDDQQVTRILMGGKNLKGTIPRDIGLLSNMEMLNLTRNELKGEIPPTFGMMSGLEMLDLSKQSTTVDTSEFIVNAHCCFLTEIFA
mmetsp:Transcript_23717/g.50436  ORF Transcript_23717/g.50436 Transcript_23717/m.50436 type:complete len:260 (-) Transcript_23717:1631-2410(-)